MVVKCFINVYGAANAGREQGIPAANTCACMPKQVCPHTHI